MKRFICLIGSCWWLVCSMAQTSSLSITTNKTTSLVFPFSVKHVDRGTKDILVQQVKEADNILLVKASRKEFSETNLSVITTEGGVYAFVVNYEENPATYVYHLASGKNTPISTYAADLLDNPKTIKRINDKKWDMEATVMGLYIKDNTIFCQLELKNESAIDYDIELLRFYIRDKKTAKRTAVQETELKPLYIAGNYTQVKAYQKNTIVVALEKFTIPDAKFLAIELMEKNGGRHLALKLKNKKIMQAIMLPDMQ